MKKIFIFSSRLRVFASEIPVLALLFWVISVHDTATSIVEYYPLEIALSAIALLILVFFFRAVLISKDEIRQIGLFSSRSKATVEEGKTLVLTLAERRIMTAELFESSDAAPALPFASDVSGQINLFREKTLGTKNTVRRVLTLFGLSKDEAAGVIDGLPTKEIAFESVAVRCEEKHDVTVFYIRMLETL